MSIILVTYDLKKPGKNYDSLHEHLKTFTYCKGLESVWLLDTAKSVKTIRDELGKITDSNDVIFVVKITSSWASHCYGCADWLNDLKRSW